MAVAGTILLVGTAPGGLAVFSVTVFGGAACLVYLASSLHHALSGGRAKTILVGLDHCAIYLLIAGTYTPFALVLLPRADWGLFALIWSLAAIGIAVQVAAFVTGRAGPYERIAHILYLAMGWMPLTWVGGLMVRALPPSGLALLLGGGFAYTVGVVFYRWHRLRYGHAVWHLFAVAGTALHAGAIRSIL